MGRETLAETNPQFSQAEWGSLLDPHLGHAIEPGAFRAWCARRVRVRHFEIFLTGSIIRPFPLIRLRSTLGDKKTKARNAGRFGWRPLLQA
jgi:hypothetical protein